MPELWELKGSLRSQSRKSFKGGQLNVGLLDMCVYFSRTLEHKRLWVSMLVDMLNVFLKGSKSRTVAISWWDFSEFLRGDSKIESIEKLGVEITVESIFQSFKNVLDSR